MNVIKRARTIWRLALLAALVVLGISAACEPNSSATPAAPSATQPSATEARAAQALATSTATLQLPVVGKNTGSPSPSPSPVPTVAPVKLEATALIVPPSMRGGPLAQQRTLNLPAGLRISVFASNLPTGPRFFAVGPANVLYVSLPGNGTVIALPDKNGDGIADSTPVVVSGLNRPHGLVFRGNELLIAETNQVTSVTLDASGLVASNRKVIISGIPEAGVHWTRTIGIAPDGAILVSIGSDCNACTGQPANRAAIWRYDADGSNGRVYASGLRNSVGFTVRPGTNEIWATENGRDGLGPNIPPEEINRIVDGGDYGWPYCYGKRIPDPEFGNPSRCANTIPPAVEMQAHSAPLGMRFIDHGLLTQFSGDLIVAFHGSWDRAEPTGYKLVRIPFSNGTPGEPQDFATGWLGSNGNDAFGRPVDVIIGPDGALYVSDDRLWAIYRIAPAN